MSAASSCCGWVVEHNRDVIRDNVVTDIVSRLARVRVFDTRGSWLVASSHLPPILPLHPASRQSIPLRTKKGRFRTRLKEQQFTSTLWKENASHYDA
jgi:hypothetical protein